MKCPTALLFKTYFVELNLKKKGKTPCTIQYREEVIYTKLLFSFLFLIDAMIVAPERSKRANHNNIFLSSPVFGEFSLFVWDDFESSVWDDFLSSFWGKLIYSLLGAFSSLPWGFFSSTVWGAFSSSFWGTLSSPVWGDFLSSGFEGSSSSTFAAIVKLVEAIPLTDWMPKVYVPAGRVDR